MTGHNGFAPITRLSALGDIPLDLIMRQVEQQLSAILGTKVGIITIAVANGHLDLASGLSRERTINCLRAALEDLEKPGSKLILPGN